VLTRADFEARLVASLDDVEIIARYNAGDPLVVQQVRANAAYLALLAQEVDVATIEPFIKTRDRSIIADATNKGILPTATPCQHLLEVINSGTVSVSLSQGRVIEDSQGGRPWRLLASVSVAGGNTAEVLVEQSELREVAYSIPITESFHRVPLSITDGLSLASLLIRDDAPTPNNYRIAPRWMNAIAGEYAVTVGTDSLRRIIVEFGDDARVGRTVQLNQTMTFLMTECYGAIDTARLKDAALAEVLTGAEQSVRVRFKAGGLVRAGADPLSVSQLRLLASYPALYDQNAVFLGNFDFLARKSFMARSDYLVVWNETVQERAYGVVSFDDINRLHLAVSAKNSGEQVLVQTEISQLLGRADSLYEGRVKVRAVVERPYQLVISGRLAAVHDIDTVTAQIRGLLTTKYGRGTVAASRWMPDGINSQEAATLLRGNLSAFQDRISDFAVSAEDLTLNPVKPHEWLYLTDDSITVTLTRTADTGGTLWTL
jgi:hypothetical protein